MTSSSVRANRPQACRIYPTNPRVHHLCVRVRVRVMIHSLLQDAGHRPQDAPGRRRAGTSVPLLLHTTPLVPHSNPAPHPRTACGNTSTRSRKQKTENKKRKQPRRNAEAKFKLQNSGNHSGQLSHSSSPLRKSTHFFPSFVLCKTHSTSTSSHYRF